MMKRWARAWRGLWRQCRQGRAATLADLFLLGWGPAVLPRPAEPTPRDAIVSEPPAAPREED